MKLFTQAISCSTSSFLSAADDAHRPCTGAHGATPHGMCINGPPRRGARPRQALEALGECPGTPGKAAVTTISSSYRQTEKEGVAHKVHRLWDNLGIPPVDLRTTHLKILDNDGLCQANSPH